MTSQSFNMKVKWCYIAWTNRYPGEQEWRSRTTETLLRNVWKKQSVNSSHSRYGSCELISSELHIVCWLPLMMWGIVSLLFSRLRNLISSTMWLGLSKSDLPSCLNLVLRLDHGNRKHIMRTGFSNRTWRVSKKIANIVTVTSESNCQGIAFGFSAPPTLLWRAGQWTVTKESDAPSLHKIPRE